MSHTNQASVIAFPSPPAIPAGINAGDVFGRNVRPGHRGWLWTVQLDGVEYLTDRYVTIRADRLSGVDTGRFDTVDFPPANVTRVLDALAAPLSGVMASTRFEVDVIAALFTAGAGILPLAGQRVPDIHAVVYCGDRIGLVTPIPSFRAEWVLGAIPGVPPGPAALTVNGGGSR